MDIHSEFGNFTLCFASTMTTSHTDPLADPTENIHTSADVDPNVDLDADDADADLGDTLGSIFPVRRASAS
jgi:hypothetical protein